MEKAKTLKEGMQVRFAPFLDHTGAYGVDFLHQKKATGTIVYINWEHKWFSVEFGKKQRISFLFSDIGVKCKLLPRKDDIKEWNGREKDV